MIRFLRLIHIIIYNSKIAGRDALVTITHDEFQGMSKHIGYNHARKISGYKIYLFGQLVFDRSIVFHPLHILYMYCMAGCLHIH